ncbi:acyltransferase domain-containing protein [Bradyrhizobium sp. SZCCHNRI2049]|uniref:acyltransferase domain-containing protein n=1 Tax=Bradyrhizobium sp. SZCCHNRI2049 TaxID=3057287 RepID=UPI002916FC86|nr:acyltransferase domain-containing protein [Bradyrhizobium sp. SZCCHNRI2049]
MSRNNRKIVFMFSGQGSQYYQMGRALFSEKKVFNEVMTELDRVAASLLGHSVVDILYNQEKQRDQEFSDLSTSSAAIFMVEYALARSLISDGIIPDLVLGASMGTYAAAAIASGISPDNALTALIRLARIFDEQCDEGTMLAVIASPHVYDEMPDFALYTEIAAKNFRSHFVVAVLKEHVDRVVSALSQRNIPFQKLPVLRAFHSKWIDRARPAALQLFEAVPLLSLSIPLICCAQGGPIATLSPNVFWRTARRPIEFSRTIEQLENRGRYIYVDLGPMGTLATFLKYGLDSLSDSTFFPMMTPFSNDLKNYQLLLDPAAGRLNL